MMTWFSIQKIYRGFLLQYHKVNYSENLIISGEESYVYLLFHERKWNIQKRVLCIFSNLMSVNFGQTSSV